MSDLIDRQAAIDALGEEPLVWYDGEDEIAEREQWRRDVNAIKALPSAQPYTESQCESAKDLISRQAALDALNQDPTNGMDYVRILNNLPSAQPEPAQEALDSAYAHGYTNAEAHYQELLKQQPERKTGKWTRILVTEPCYYRCSACGAGEPAEYNYCPECGVRMEGE